MNGKNGQVEPVPHLFIVQNRQLPICREAVDGMTELRTPFAVDMQLPGEFAPKPRLVVGWFEKNGDTCAIIETGDETNGRMPVGVIKLVGGRDTFRQIKERAVKAKKTVASA